MSRSLNLLVRRIALHFAAKNVSVTAWVARSIRAPRSTVIWNPVRIHDFKPSLKVNCHGRFTFVGRLVTQKGVDTLLHALSVCHKKGKHYDLDIYGDGPERGNLELLARSINLDETVHFHGAVQGEQLSRAMNEAGVVVVPSTYEEAMGIVAVEAMAAGKSLIVSRHGGLAEVSEGCSLTFENGDHRELADRMTCLAENEGLRESLAQRGPERAQLFAPERIIDDYLALYRKILTK